MRLNRKMTFASGHSARTIAHAFASMCETVSFLPVLARNSARYAIAIVRKALRSFFRSSSMFGIVARATGAPSSVARGLSRPSHRQGTRLWRAADDRGACLAPRLERDLLQGNP